MRFDGYDFIICGAVLGVGGGLLFGKAYLMPSFPMEAAQTYLGSNPFLVRGAIVTRHEGVAGALWLVAGLLFSLIGTVRSVRAGQKGHLIESWFDIIVLLALGLVVWRLTIAITDRTSRAEYLPILSGMMGELYTRDRHVITHNGQYAEERMQRIEPSPHVRKERLVQAREALESIGKLLDEPRLKEESDVDFARRLSRFFPGTKSTGEE